jgi:hypothetical protein
MMNEFIEKIKHLPNDVQIDMLLDLLQEIGGSIQTTRNQYNQYWCERMRIAMENHIKSATDIKSRIRQIITNNF